MTAHLPPSLLALFAPRPPLPFVSTTEKPALPPYTGIAEYVKLFTDPATDTFVGSRPFETKPQKKARIQKDRWTRSQDAIAENVKSWIPAKDPKAAGDPTKTLFVGRINFNTSEHKLKREFEYWGPIKRVRIVNDLKGKPRGYAFVEFEREKDMRIAYKEADGKKIDNRRVVVDYERGRISKSWRPKRLGGGRGFTRAGKEDLNAKFSDKPIDKDEKRDERERSRERERSPEKPRERERERDKPSSSSSSSSKSSDGRDRSSSGKRERERDRVGNDRY